MANDNNDSYSAIDGPNDAGGNGTTDSTTPLLKTSPVRRSFSLSNKLSGLLQDWWLWEVIGAITCVIALAVIVVVLAIYDSCSLPDWPSVFTVRELTLLFFSS